MLTGELLRARGSREVVKPGFIDPSSARYLERAEAILSVVGDAVSRGLTLGELKARLEEEIIGTGIDHKLTRGLVKIVLDRCEFDTECRVDPAALRARLFACGPASRRTVVAGLPSAKAVIARVADEFGCTPEEVVRGMYADLKDNQVIRSVSPLRPIEVLHRYNIALVQGLLLHAGDVEITLDAPSPERLRQLVRHVRFQQLMLQAERIPGGIRIVLDGPASLFRFSTRYGMALARFFPALPLQPGPWVLRTRVKWKGYYRLLQVGSDQGLVSPIPDTGAWISREEQWFEERFRDFQTDWNLKRTGEILDLGRGMITIPDYEIRKGERVAWLEVVGMWRRTWLRRKLEAIEGGRASNLLLAVNRNLLGDRTGKELLTSSRIISFSKVISPADVVAAAQRHALPADPTGRPE